MFLAVLSGKSRFSAIQGAFVLDLFFMPEFLDNRIALDEIVCKSRVVKVA